LLSWFESVHKDEVVDCLVESNLTNKRFMTTRCCLTNLLEFSEFIAEAVYDEFTVCNLFRF